METKMSTNESYDNILIVGIGLIGGSLGLALKRKGFKGTILGVDSPDVLKQASKRQFLDEAYALDNLKEAVEKANLIFICTPILDIIKLLPLIGRYVKPNTLITDVGSTKRKIIETANIHLPADCDFIGGHPMAGSEFRGVKAADPFLFENTTYVLTPSRPISEKRRRSFGELLERLGAKVLLLLPELHDEIAAAVSHLPQMASVALMNLVASRQKESAHFLKMAAGGFRDMTRVASSPYGIWSDILETNSDMIVSYIEQYINELIQVKQMLEAKNLEKYFEKSARDRLSIPSDTKGFLKPHFDILVSVEDRPGMISQITNGLSERNVNIKDIEVLKIREDEGGTLRLAFSSEGDRELALTLLKKIGFECRKRD